ncbi:MAG: Snf7 family protein [Desulfurococcaceae archaeon]
MVSGFLNKREETIGGIFKSIIKPDREPIDKKIILAHYKIKTSIGRINNYLDKLEQRDKELFQIVVESLMKRDEKRAKMYAREVAEVRRVSKQLITAKYALEQVSLKLETFLIFEGAIRELPSVIKVMQEAIELTKTVAPDVWIDLQYAIRELETSMSAGLAGIEMEIDVGVDSEAKKILEEARIAAEQTLREKFAELPSSISVSEEAKTSGTV